MGRGHKGLGKIKVNDAMQLADVSSVTAVTGECATVEPFIDSKYDVHVQKIGPSYKAFIRKGITGQWKTNTGSSMLFSSIHMMYRQVL
uniref:Synapsin ATP-binding domain-containing protein n=1 Tax=Plectus sambesii TaxID=2011161 RepID=A0A914UIM3_9BILA